MASVLSRSGSVSLWRHLPNAISVLRIVLVVPVAWAIWGRSFQLALWLALVAGISDGVDGWLARHFNWRSRLGGILDPAADKALLVTSFVLLAMVAWIPLWLAVVVVGRDVAIALGVLIWQGVIGHFSAKPSWLSKCCTTVQIIYVLTVLAVASGWFALPSGALLALTWLVAVLTLASGIDYLLRWARSGRRALTLQAGQDQRGPSREP